MQYNYTETVWSVDGNIAGGYETHVEGPYNYLDNLLSVGTIKWTASFYANIMKLFLPDRWWASSPHGWTMT